MEAQAQAKALREKRLAEARELRKKQSAKAARITDAADALAKLALTHPQRSAKSAPTASGNTAATATPPPPPPTTLAAPPPPPHSSVHVVDSPGAAAAAEPAKSMAGPAPPPQKKSTGQLRQQEDNFHHSLLPGVTKEQGNAMAKAAPAGVVSNKQSAFAAAAAVVAAEADARHAQAVKRAGRAGFWQHLVRPDETQAEVLANLNTSYSEALLGGLFAVGGWWLEAQQNLLCRCVVGSCEQAGAKRRLGGLFAMCVPSPDASQRSVRQRIWVLMTSGNWGLWSVIACRER